MSSRPVSENVFIGPFNKLQYIRDDLVRSVCYGKLISFLIISKANCTFRSRRGNIVLFSIPGQGPLIELHFYSQSIRSCPSLLSPHDDRNPMVFQLPESEQRSRNEIPFQRNALQRISCPRRLSLIGFRIFVIHFKKQNYLNILFLFYQFFIDNFKVFNRSVIFGDFSKYPISYRVVCSCLKRGSAYNCFYPLLIFRSWWFLEEARE